MIDYSIVYKTYQNDLGWLKYSLFSLKKQISILPPIVIYYHSSCLKDLNNILSEVDLNPILIPVDYDIHGYLKQMVVKCMCFEDIQTEYIMIMDCDVILKSKFNIYESFGTNGKINWSVRKRNQNNTSEPFWSVWEKSVENMVGEKMTTYYMSNGFPFLFKRKTLSDASQMFQSIHRMNYNDFCKFYLEKYQVSTNDSLTGKDGKFNILATIFEEFEYLGWFAHNHTDDYNFLETSNSNSYKISQYWSHGGLSSEIEREIQELLR